MIFAAEAKGGEIDGHSAFDHRVCTVLQKDFRALEGAKMNIFLSILGTAIVTILIAGAYSIGVSVGRAAVTEDNQEPVIYMEHTHGGE